MYIPRMDLEIDTYQPKTEFYETRHAQRGWEYTAGLGWMIVPAHNSAKLAFFENNIVYAGNQMFGSVAPTGARHHTSRFFDLIKRGQSWAKPEEI